MVFKTPIKIIYSVYLNNITKDIMKYTGLLIASTVKIKMLAKAIPIPKL